MNEDSEYMKEDIHIHGGVVGNIHCEDDVHMHGGIVQRMTVEGDCKQYGGIIQQRIAIDGEAAVAQQHTQQAKPKVVFKDRVVYKDRIVYRDREKVVYRDKPQKEYEKEMNKLRGIAKHLQEKCDALEAENNELAKIIEDTERQKLLREIEDLKEKLHKARQRENVAVQQRKDAEREARIAKSQVWDDFKPTKEQVKAFYKIVRICMDCETDE